MMVGIPIFLTVAALGILYTSGKHILVKRDYAFKRQFFPILRNINLCFDGFANACGGELLNDALGIPEGQPVRYGSWHETISAITGIVYLKIKDTWLRRFLKVLGKNHCTAAITPMQKVYYKIEEK